MTDVWEQIQDVYYRSKNMIGRGYAISQKRDGKMPTVRVKTNSGTEYEGLDFITTPGIASYPKNGEKTEFLVLSVGGDLSHAVALPIGDRANFKKLEKEGFAVHDPNNPARYALFDDDGVTLCTEGGKKFTLGKDGKLTIEGEVTFKSDVTFEGSINGTGVPGQKELKIGTNVRISQSLKVDAPVTAPVYNVG